MGGSVEGGDDCGDGSKVELSGPALGDGLLVEAGEGEAAVTGYGEVRVSSWLRVGAGRAGGRGGV